MAHKLVGQVPNDHDQISPLWLAMGGFKKAVNFWYSTRPIIGPTTTTTVASSGTLNSLSNVVHTPLYTGGMTAISDVGYEMGTLAVGVSCIIRVGLYADTGTGTPTGAPLFTTSKSLISGTSVVGVNTIAALGWTGLTKPMYWLAYVVQGSTVTTFPTFKTAASPTNVSMGNQNTNPTMGSFGFQAYTETNAGALTTTGAGGTAAGGAATDLPIHLTVRYSA